MICHMNTTQMLRKILLVKFLFHGTISRHFRHGRKRYLLRKWLLNMIRMPGNIYTKCCREIAAAYAIDIDSQIELTASVYPANATFSEISWESSNPEVISVSGENFKINNTGDVVLTAKSHDGVESSIELTVVSEAMIIEICIGVGAVCLIIVGVIVVLKKKSRRIN